MSFGLLSGHGTLVRNFTQATTATKYEIYGIKWMFNFKKRKGWNSYSRIPKRKIL